MKKLLMDSKLGPNVRKINICCHNKGESPQMELPTSSKESQRFRLYGKKKIQTENYSKTKPGSAVSGHFMLLLSVDSERNTNSRKRERERGRGFSVLTPDTRGRIWKHLHDSAKDGAQVVFKSALSVWIFHQLSSKQCMF